MGNHQNCCSKASESEQQVDCLLSVSTHKLGGGIATYLTERRAIKTTAQNCEVRGGGYVAYDRATQTSALQVWLPQALRGLAEAHVSLGKFTNKGSISRPTWF